MAQVVVDSGVMRDKANTIKTASKSIQTLYAEMLQEVTATAGKMKGETIETQKNRFANMQTTFDTFAAYMEKYGDFLTQAAEYYEAAEHAGTQKAQEQGKVF